MVSVYLAGQIAAQVLGFHGSLERRSVLESKLAYIRAWEGLQDFGLSYFIIKFSTYKAKDVSWLAVCIYVAIGFITEAVQVLSEVFSNKFSTTHTVQLLFDFLLLPTGILH